MPNRIIKESICYSESIKGLTWFEEVLFYRLIVNADDYGRLDGRIEMLQSRLFPLRRDITDKAITTALNALTTAGMVRPYTVEQHPFLQLAAWESHQQIRAQKSKFPPPPEHDRSGNQMISDAPVIQSNPNPIRESKSEKDMGGKPPQIQKFIPPSSDDVQAYCQERQNTVDPQRFVDFYSAKGWMVGKNKMKDWRACIRTWEKNPSQHPFQGKSGARRKTNEELAAELFGGADDDGAGSGTAYFGIGAGVPKQAE